MSEVTKIRIRNLRNLGEVSLTPSPRVNIIYGENGSGKTSILEGLHLIGLGRSFRSRQASPIVQLGSSETVVFARVAGRYAAHAIGVAKSKDGETRIRLDGASASIGDLARLTPLVVVAPESFELLAGGPKERRQFLDWGVFHVEPSYIEVWRNYQRALKQRNSLLRRGRIAVDQFAAWNRQMAAYAETMDDYRVRYLEKLATKVVETLGQFTAQLADLKIDYIRGWPRERCLEELLTDGLAKDQLTGRTQYGPHRCDLRLTIHGLDAREHLSRGQQKLVVCAMKLAQGLCLSELTGEKSVYLVDDLHAELDERNAETFCKLLDLLQTQVFITSLNAEHIKIHWKPDVPLEMFHVEQGTVTQASNITGEFLNE